MSSRDGSFDGLGPGEGTRRRGRYIALALLLEADSDAVAHELVRERTRDAGDAELEMDLLKRRHVTGQQPRLDEVEHLFWCDALVVDPVEHLLRRQRRVADPVRHVEGPDWVLRVVD